MTFLSFEFGKGEFIFCPVKLSRLAEKKKQSSSEIPKFHKPGQMPLMNKSFKSQMFLEGSGHPNFVNPCKIPVTQK